MAYQSRKRKKQKDFKVRFRVWGILALIISLFAAVYYFSRYEPWVFKTVVFEGNDRVDVELVEEQIWKELESPWYVFFAQNNRAFFPREQIKSVILESHPLMQDLEITLEKDNSFIITIEERGPQYIVCDRGIEFAQLTSQQKSLQCAFVDYNGLAYEMYDGAVSHEALFIEQNVQDIRIPLSFFDTEEIKYLRDIVVGLETMMINKIIFHPTQSTDVYLNDDFHIKFTELAPLIWQFQNIEIALGKPIEEISFDGYLYVDARFPGELYVRELSEESDITPEKPSLDDGENVIDSEVPVDNDEILDEDA